jgi:trk system potassium uptake protein TrkA
MKKTVLVIGLGTFGSQIARTLAQGGATVLAVDRDEEKVNWVSKYVAKSVRADAIDSKAMKSIGAYDAEIAIVALRRHFDMSVLTTHLLRQAGIQQILVQVDNELEADAIRMVGATSVIFPERDMATRMAQKLLVPDLAEFIPLGADTSIIEMPCPASFVGKSLVDLQVRKISDVTVIGIKSHEETEGGVIVEQVQVPVHPHHPLKASEILIVVGKTDHLESFKKKIGQ